jgi:outer membrane protein TolC
MKSVLMLLLVFCSLMAQAQKTFTEEELVAVVRQYHPVARQAALGVRIAESDITRSRGAFDPLLQLNRNRKEFDGITYYNQGGYELKVPTWYGIDLYTGTEEVLGERQNPEETKGTIRYIGVSVPLVQNLVIDKRRAALQQARIFRDQSLVQQRIVLNDLLLESLIAYWEWWEQSEVLKLVQASLTNARQRFKMVKTAVTLGDRPAIDTLEAFTQVQTFELRESEILMELVKARLQLSTYLWREGDVPYELPADVQPQRAAGETEMILDALLTLSSRHPELLEYNFKLRGLEIDRRLKFQSLLPDVDLKYQQIGRDYGKTINGAWFQNDYRFGVGISVPLRLSEGRGAFQGARLKIEQTKLQQLNKGVQIRAKVQQYFAEWSGTRQQVVLQTSLAGNYLALQRGEEIRFANGESSLFLINSRELRSIEGQQKLIELRSKNRQSEVKLRWAAGIFGNL